MKGAIVAVCVYYMADLCMSHTRTGWIPMCRAVLCRFAESYAEDVDFISIFLCEVFFLLGTSYKPTRRLEPHLVKAHNL